jgi:hypothetical protein
MREIRTSGLMSGIWKQNTSVSLRQISTLPRPSLTMSFNLSAPVLSRDPEAATRGKLRRIQDGISRSGSSKSRHTRGLKTGAGKLKGVVSDGRAEFFALPPTPDPASASSQNKQA